MAKPKTRAEVRRIKAKRHKPLDGHPAKVAATKRARAPITALSAEERQRELERQLLCRKLSVELRRNDEEGPLVGPLAVAAERAAEVLSQAGLGLDHPEHVVALTCYLTERLGAVLDDFSVVDYRDWRLECLDRLTEQLAEQEQAA